MDNKATLEAIGILAEALLAERAYHSNNTGENAARRTKAMRALPKGWEKLARLAPDAPKEAT